MARYHVNPHTGDYGVCHADKGKCPFGGVSGTENYYSNDKNYNWYAVIDTEDDELYYPIDVNADELESIYKLEEMERKISLF